MISGAHLLCKSLQKNSVKDVFIYTGGAIMPVIDSLYKDTKINYFLHTHEQSLGHAATGYAKSLRSKVPGVCLVTSGPGLTNMITPITDANNDSTPLIVFSGQVSKNVMGTNAFQECPSVDITKPITKWSYCIQSTDEIETVVDKAFHIATEGKPGAVHIDLPKCVVQNMINHPENATNEENILDNDIFNYNYSSYEFHKIIKKINNAKKPVLIVGKGCEDSFELLREFAQKANIPVTTTIHGMGIYDETEPLSLEFLGMHGNVAANYSVQRADLIINIGSRFDDRTIGNPKKYAPEANKSFQKNEGGIIHVNVSKDDFNVSVKSHYNIQSTSRDFLKNVIPHCNFLSRKKWLNDIKRWKNKFPFDYNLPPNKKLNTQIVIDTLGKNMDKLDYIVTTGVGNHQMMASQFIKWKDPGRFITSGSLGVMGVSTPYSIGCQLANPDKLIVSIDGDGSFNHTLAELKTIKNYNLPIKIAIMNDGEMSMVKAWEHLFFEKRYAATNLTENPDYVSLANAFGIHGMSCDSRDTLQETIESFLSFPGPVLCDFRVESDLCLPLVKPGNSLDDILKLQEEKNPHEIDISTCEVPN